MRINGGSGGDGVRSTGINGGNGGSSSVAGINGGEGGSSSAAGINGGDGGSSSAVGMNGGDGATATAMAVLLVASDVPSPIRLLRSRGVPERNGPPPGTRVGSSCDPPGTPSDNAHEDSITMSPVL